MKLTASTQFSSLAMLDSPVLSVPQSNLQAKPRLVGLSHYSDGLKCKMTGEARGGIIRGLGVEFP